MLDRLLTLLANLSERRGGWIRLPFLLALGAIIGNRGLLRHKNLTDTETAPPSLDVPVDAGLPGDFDRDGFRMPDGSFNDRTSRWMGMAGRRFGRNVPLADGFGEREQELMRPSPRHVSNTLMARKSFVPVPSLNVMAAAWIQFMVHDWLSHGPNDPDVARRLHVPLDQDDRWPPDRPDDAENGPMTVLSTTTCADLGPADEGRPMPYTNTETHWWDGSQIYGSSWAKQDMLRRENGLPDGARLDNGKLWLDAEGMLPLDPTETEKRPNQELSGVNGNWWIGLSMLHTLFAREHNAIVDCLRAEYPYASGEWLFQKARLANAALMAKIHTVEWTPALMDSSIGRMAMRGNYWGLMGERFHKGMGRISDDEVISGIPGTPTDHHGAPYAMTEEFTAVYRLHSLLPDDFDFRDHKTDRHLASKTLLDVFAGGARTTHDEVGFANTLYSLATEHPGAMVLHNYPQNLRRLNKKPEDGVWLDLATVDILRDRERGVPRYTAFRKALGMKPITRFEDLTSVKADVELLREVYEGDIDRVDLLIGCMAEFQSPRQPVGFGFSDTAFRIFILMASRRLKSDRFYTTDFNPEVYTPAGFNWVLNNGLRDVVRRHLPELEPHFADTRSMFYPWQRGGA
jgi:hypothetical protein